MSAFHSRTRYSAGNEEKALTNGLDLLLVRLYERNQTSRVRGLCRVWHGTQCEGPSLKKLFDTTHNVPRFTPAELQIGMYVAFTGPTCKAEHA